MDLVARGLYGCIHQHRIKPLQKMIGPRRNHHARILSGLEERRWKGFLEPACQEKQRWAVIAQNRHGTDGNEMPGFHPSCTHGLTSRNAAHRMACENIHRPDLACDRLQRVHGVHESKLPRRRSVPRLVNAIANESGSR